MPRRAGRVLQARGVLLPMAIAMLLLAGCAPRPQFVRAPQRGVVVLRPPLRKPLTPAPCPPRSVALTETDKAELFRQFEAWQRNGGTGPAPQRQMADAGNCGASVP